MSLKSLFKKPKSVLVSGSGRSGTSLMMGCISHNYKNTGKIPACRDDDSNPKGFFEDVEINFLNDRLIETSGVTLLGNKTGKRNHRYGGWINKEKVSELKINPSQIAQIKQLTALKPFCFKDPRFSFTYPLWREIINETFTLLIIFRHPAKTAISMIKEPTPKEINMSYSEALEVWYSQYSNILSFDDQEKFIFIHYDQIFNKKIDFLAQVLNIKIDYSFIDPSLNRSKQKNIPNKYKKMYDLLISKSEKIYL